MCQELKWNYVEHFQNLLRSGFLVATCLACRFIHGANTLNFFPACWTLAIDIFKNLECNLQKTALYVLKHESGFYNLNIISHF